MLAPFLVLLALLAIRSWVLTPYEVASDSMAPALSSGSWVLVDRVSWRFDGARRGDVVVVDRPNGELVVKRVVATAGQQVALDDGWLVVDGLVVDEPLVDHSRVDGTWFGPVTVPSAHVFVLGDNRETSIDSRHFGPVPVSSVDGRVVPRP